MVNQTRSVKVQIEKAEPFSNPAFDLDEGNFEVSYWYINNLGLVRSCDLKIATPES
jgi:hypothetical protein